MALDGITIANIANELNTVLSDGRLNKIAQPEPDELMLTVKNNRSQYRLTISSNASLPLIYLTDENKPSPATAPGFCMLLRKHLNNARIVSVKQIKLERVIDFSFEHLDEMGDLRIKHLIVELMGKHSNIIFTDDGDRIIDSIKRISSQMSSVREVLPGRYYFIPDTMDKTDPLDITADDFKSHVVSKPMKLSKAIYTGLTGISPVIAEELCHIAQVESSQPANTIDEKESERVYNALCGLMTLVKSGGFTPNIIYKGKSPVEFASVPLTVYEDDKEYQCIPCESASRMLYTFYAQKNAQTRIHQRSSDLRRIISTLLERNYRKLEIQEKQLADTDKRDKFRIYGELLNTYGYSVPSGSRSFETVNYYTGEPVTIPLDDTLTPQENAVRFFDRYNKLKRTFEATTKLLEETRAEIAHLESIATALDIAVAEEDLIQLKEEMIQSGYINRKGASGKKVKITSRPFHYISSDGYHIYVGKNNLQNEELSFKLANGSDWWFHAKEIPGSHVIVKTNGDELPDRTFEEAARLAAYYSKGREQDKVEVDYTPRKNLKKPAGAKPGFVIYHTNYSMLADTDISGISKAD